ncbi:putative quinol monooxygenase [Paraglaciecola aquimarina]|uniref:Quinol monooxygenase n=1 Tax=Paraglaciecola aquimarina TaxID=1235557 RepID=A0ABU3SYC6_9ALTE|nr:putative quinol monooxygenase [Paraglaciecola aquimarina]MDU0355018.1 putative quinol monooxygenase [Paraglaciecola aquimarina]
MYVVTVKFDIKPNFLTDFTGLVLKQANDSMQLENNCLRFDVAYAEHDQNQIYLYEIYLSKQDFDLHLQSEHFRTFSNNVSHMLVGKQVECFVSMQIK